MSNKSTASNFADLSKVTCYRCGRTGHVSSQCRKGLLRQLSLHLQTLNPYKKSLIGSLIKICQTAKQIPLELIKMLSIDLRGVFLLRKVNTNKHFTYSSTVEVFLNELFNGLALDEIKASSYEEESRLVEPLDKEIQQACTLKKENTREINAFSAKMLENPADYINIFKIIMPNYEIEGYKIRNFDESEKFKNIIKQAVLDPTFKRDFEIYFGYNKHKIEEISEKVEENRQLAKDIKERISLKKEIIQEEQSTRNMIHAAYPEVKKQEKEEIKNQKEAEKKKKEKYLRNRDRKNYQIQKQRLNWEKRKLERQRIEEEKELDQQFETNRPKFNDPRFPDALERMNHKKKLYEAKYGTKYREKPPEPPKVYPKKHGDESDWVLG